MGEWHPSTHMLAKRKSRRQEDEPLVPHGLVWQATAETEADREGTASLAQQTAEEAKLIVISPRQNEDVAISPTGDASLPVPPVSKKPAASSPPLFWRSLKKPELVKTATLEAEPASAPAVQQSANCAKREDLQGPAPQRPRLGPALAVIRARMVGASVQFAEKRRSAKRTSTRIWQAIQSSARGSRETFKLACRKVGDRCRSLEFQTWIEPARLWILAQSRSAVERTRAHRERLRRGAASLLSSSLVHAKRQADRIHALSYDRNASPGPHNSIHSAVRIRLTGLPRQARTLFARANSEWRLKGRGLHGDSRLWTSMAMAALSALLALALVTTVRHYGTAALPSHLSNSNPTLRLNNPAASSAVPIKPPAIHADAPARSPDKRAIHTKRVRPAPPVRPRHRRSEDDDYVARDTYVYYGNKSSGSR